MKKLLLTGSNGFIGQHCIPYLLSQNYEIHALCFPQPPFILKNKNLHFYTQNIFGYEEIAILIKKIKPNYLLHLAWLSHSYSSLEHFSWIKASINLIEEFIKNKGDYILCAGTCFEYDFTSITSPLTESAYIQPSSMYGLAKDMVHRILSLLAQSHSFSFCWGRIFYTYGKNQDNLRRIPSLIYKLVHDQPFTCQSGDLVRDFLNVDDIAKAFVCILNKQVKGAINIASGKEIQIQYIVNYIAEYLAKKHLVTYEKNSFSKEPSYIVADVSRLISEVTWKPSSTMEESLQATIKWYLQKLNNEKLQTDIFLKKEEYHLKV